MLIRKLIKNNYLFLFIFLSHFGIAIYILSKGELGAYLMFGVWEFPFFSIAESLYASSVPFSFQNITVALLGATFWGSLIILIKKFPKVIRGSK